MQYEEVELLKRDERYRDREREGDEGEVDAGETGATDKPTLRPRRRDRAGHEHRHDEIRVVASRDITAVV